MFDALISWFVVNLGLIVAEFAGVAYEFANDVILLACSVMDWAVSMLPAITLPTFNQWVGDAQFFVLLNWFIPLDTIVYMLSIWLISETAHFALSPVMRFVRLIK